MKKFDSYVIEKNYDFNSDKLQKNLIPELSNQVRKKLFAHS